MHLRHAASYFVLLVVLCSLVALPLSAASMIVGSAIESVGARIDSHAVRAGRAILSGESLQVEDGSALISLNGGSRLDLGKNTTASFQREGEAITAVLDHGTLHFQHPSHDKTPLRIRAADISMVPEGGSETLATIAMTSDTLIVMTREGGVSLQGGGKSVRVPQGKMITLHSYPARAPQISASTARPAFEHDLEIAGLTIIGAVGMSLLIDDLINNANNNRCKNFIATLHPSPSGVLKCP
jgi:hypothetical protein